MKAIILACSTLTNHVNAAQEAMHTNYPLIEIDNQEHDRPKKLWKTIFNKIETSSEEVDIILLALGVCGGGAIGLPFPKRVVMPRVDDCMTLLMHQDDTFHYNLKKAGHYYLTENQDLMSIARMRDDLVLKYGERRGMRVLNAWFDGYKSVDIIDTGIYDSYSKDYLDRANAEANLIRAPVLHVPGSNRLLEKLVSGKWDDQFQIYEPEECMQETDFYNE